MGFRSNYRRGVHGLVVKFMESHFKGRLKNKNIIVAGMGEIGRRTAGLIEETFKCFIQPVNRTIKESHQGNWQPLTELKSFSLDADALVVATGGTTAVIGPENLALVERDKPLLIMDIGIPRQVTDSAQNHSMVLYRNIDHLMELEDKQEKSGYVSQLEAEIRKEYHHFKQFCRGREMSALLSEIHTGRLELTQTHIPEFVASQLSDLDEKRRKDIENALKQYIKDYSNSLFQAFHQTMETYWSNNNGN
jgi:glutamyl-tRNA reductase